MMLSLRKKGVAVGVILLFVGVAVAPSINFNVVKASNDQVRENEINQKELLFQTILDIANNKEIQKIAFNSEIRGKGFFDFDIRFSVFTTHMLTKKELNSAYNLGLMFLKTLSKSTIHSIVEHYQMNNQEIQNELYAVIEARPEFQERISSLHCDCENDNTTGWKFPVICGFLYAIFVILSFFLELSPFPVPPGLLFYFVIIDMWQKFGCKWANF